MFLGSSTSTVTLILLEIQLISATKYRALQFFLICLICILHFFEFKWFKN